MIRVIKASTVDSKIQQVIDNNLTYDYMGDFGMVNPSLLLKKYEYRYNDIRPKDIEFGQEADGDYYIQYVSQGCTNSNAMFHLVYAAISKDPELKKMYYDGKLKIQVCDRNNWGNWTTFSKKKNSTENSTENNTDKKKNFDEDYLNFVDKIEQALRSEFSEEDISIHKYEEEYGFEFLLDLQLISKSKKNYLKQRAQEFANKFKISFKDIGGLLGCGVFEFIVKSK